jgi:hypothetical protein
MIISKLTVATFKAPRNLLTLDCNDFPLVVQYGNTNYVLVLTKSKKLLLQKPLELDSQ